MISLTCFVVQPCLLDNSWLFILYTTSCGMSGGLPLLFVLFFNPSIPSSLCISLTSQKTMFCFCEDLLLPVLQEYVCHHILTTFNTSNILSFRSASDSRLYSCSNLVLLEGLLLSIKRMDCMLTNLAKSIIV